MHAVGIRELKNRLSHYVRLVRAGQSVLVTDRGSVVAELRPPGIGVADRHVDPIDARLAELVRLGRAVTAEPHDPDLYAPRVAVLPGGSVARLLDAERGGR
jgi:antitoxin (DNA-binding transcriptional repressor) of toxin-antitoxin stability system